MIANHHLPPSYPKAITMALLQVDAYTTAIYIITLKLLDDLML
jgi:hypothetical protein